MRAALWRSPVAVARAFRHLARALNDMTSISVCICTFRRPSGLAKAIASAAGQALPPGVGAEIVIVDNDPAGSARAVFDTLQTQFPAIALRYFHEPQAGISFARNRCLNEATGQFIAFLDDDETARPNWLYRLLTTIEETGADAVFGPVLSRFAETPPPWLIDSGAHQRPRFKTGSSIGWGDSRTGNVMFTRKVVELVGGFDPRLAHTGGEDSFFFALAISKGARLVWCDEAIVDEDVPTERMQRNWILRRAFFGGRTFTRLRAELEKSKTCYLHDGLRGLASIVWHGPQALILCLAGQPQHLRHARKVAGGLGKLGASFISAGTYGALTKTPLSRSQHP